LVCDRWVSACVLPLSVRPSHVVNSHATGSPWCMRSDRVRVAWLLRSTGPNPAPVHLRRQGHRFPSARRRAAIGSCVMPALVALGGVGEAMAGDVLVDLDQWDPVVERTRLASKAYFLLIATSMKSSKYLAERRQIYCWKWAVNAIRWRSRAASAMQNSNV
jgi:hypothetical protein